MTLRAVRHPYLFNFSSSYSGGGLKRLHAYSEWFGMRGGAWIIIHSDAAHLVDLFPANRYFVVRQSLLRRVYNDAAYLADICTEIGKPQLYYAYGIPIYRRIGRVNWFHLSNLLPVHSTGVPQTMMLRAKMRYLGWQIVRNYSCADVISAESRFSLEHLRISPADKQKLFLSVNGSDDELAFVGGPVGQREELAVAVGTMGYKALGDTYRVFEMLRARNTRLRLVLIGPEKWVPAALRRRVGVETTGALPRDEVVEYLARARYYISTTQIENSYNAAAEGLFLAEESYLSDIGPHRELLVETRTDAITVPGVNREMFHVRGSDASPAALRTWDQVIVEMLERATAGDVGADNA